MIENTGFKTYDAPPLNKSEVIRYMRGKSNEQTESIINECFDEVNKELTFRVVWKEFPVIKQGDTLDVGFCKTNSNDLKNNLKDAKRIVLFAASVGLGADRLIAKYKRISPLKALCVDAMCNERIEALCDLFNSEITEKEKQNGFFTAPRFSVGYGDLPIELQKNILDSLDAARKIGITLNDGYLMTPTKSVTGIIGISEHKCEGKTKCELCKNYTCEFRRKR